MWAAWKTEGATTRTFPPKTSRFHFILSSATELLLCSVTCYPALSLSLSLLTPAHNLLSSYFSYLFFLQSTLESEVWKVIFSVDFFPPYSVTSWWYVISVVTYKIVPDAGSFTLPSMQWLLRLLCSLLPSLDSTPLSFASLEPWLLVWLFVFTAGSSVGLDRYSD